MRTRGKILAMSGAAVGALTALAPTAAAAAEPVNRTAAEPQIPQEVRQRIVDWANRELGDAAHNVEVPLDSDCNFYSGVFQTGGTDCDNGFRSEFWCADFAKYVWKNGGADVTGLNAATESFQAYGRRHGTWHADGNLTGIKPGDVIVYDDDNDPTTTFHVGVAVPVNDTMRVISGNVNDRVYKHDVNYLDRPIGYVRPVV